MLTSALIYLLAAVIAVPIAKRFGLGSVLGYLIAGILIGPSALGIVGDQTDVMHFAEFGVVMMLFLVGLELQPSRLWSMRKPILGLGGLQVGLSTLAISGLIWCFSPASFNLAIAIGLSVALSSTAIVIQSLTERNQMDTQAGSNAFSVLLFQDIAVIPILALFPLLASFPVPEGVDAHGSSLIEGLPAWMQIAAIVGAIGTIIALGRFLSMPLFGVIARTGLRELFTAFALLIVVAIAVAMQALGLSAALGTFVAGVVLADSEFRHEIEVDMEPFKGLLLGLFFITVGANIDFNLFAEQFALILGLVAALILVKLMVLGILAYAFKMDRSQGLLFALALAQGGEFAFVLASAGRQFSVFDDATSNMLTLVVALSMLIAPLLFVAYEKLMSRASQNAAYEDEEQVQPTCQVIVAGFGRFGQIVARLLQSNGFDLTILDHSSSQIELVRRFGNRVFYGDASRRDLLEAAGANRAQLLIVGVDQADKALEIIDTAQKHFPHLKILARAIDRRHAYDIHEKKVHGFQRETFHSALALGNDALRALGVSEEQADRVTNMFSQHDQESLLKLSEVWGDDKSYGRAVRQRMEDLKQVLANDAEQIQASQRTGRKK